MVQPVWKYWASLSLCSQGRGRSGYKIVSGLCLPLRFRLDLLVPMTLVLSSATTWVTERGLFLLVFGFGEACEPALGEKCGIWVEYYWGACGCAGFFSLGTKMAQEGYVFSLWP